MFDVHVLCDREPFAASFYKENEQLRRNISEGESRRGGKGEFLISFWCSAFDVLQELPFPFEEKKLNWNNELF